MKTMHARRKVRAMRQMMVNHGWAAAMHTASGQLRRKLRPPAAVDPVPWLTTDIHEFDTRYGVDTSGLIWSVDLKTGSPNDAWNTAYYAIPPSVFHRVMGELPATLVRDAIFLDLGCGKGRALLLASEYPFARVTGVEISPRLHAVATQNASRYNAIRAMEGRARVPEVNILLEDAASFRFPAGPLVVYLYNPFCRPVLRRVIENLGHALARDPQPAAVVYINHEVHDLLDRAPFLRRFWAATVTMDAYDRLADRVGSSTEDCAIYLATEAPHREP